ncbi:hypothetical protein J437_LFUL009940 [Ladona fulva]|uniref:DDE Tnp4 domain-containing protein n=1 Tax=Ladona fulva TaxID=123851 RepID=A0A8K0P2B4_LADFU|nr:hypothetical protein J437_LFUL009940 [Ladona fulva]
MAQISRYLATGDNQQIIAFSFRMGSSTVSKIVKQVCLQIRNTLQPIYLPPPTRQMWKKVEEDFLAHWAVVDPHYKFMIVDIGSYGRHSESAILENSAFYREYIDGKSILPPKPLPGTGIPVPHVFVGDEGFALQTYLMRPYPKAGINTDPRKRRFNAQLSRARRVVENAFGILAMKWRIFLRSIEADVETADRKSSLLFAQLNYDEK